MKLTILFNICFLIVSVCNATDRNPKKKILIVGFSSSYFTSNSSETIARKNGTSEDSLSNLINSRLLEIFTEELNDNFEYQSVEDVRHVSPGAQTSFYYVLPVKNGDLTSVEINGTNIERLCGFYDADIVVFINSYELNWEEDPYLVYSHMFDSEMFVKTGEKIGEGRVSFMMEDVRLKDKFSIRLAKQLSKMLKKLENVKVNNTAMVNN